MTLSNIDINGDIYISGDKIVLENVNAKGTIYINIGSKGTILLDGTTAPRVEIVPIVYAISPEDINITIESSKIGTLEDLNIPSLIIIDNDTKIDRYLTNVTVDEQESNPDSGVTQAVYFNALPPEVKALNNTKQSFQILVQVTGATFKEDLDGFSYDRAFRVVSAPTGFGVGTLSNGKPDVWAVRRVSPNILKIRIDGRFPLYLDDRIIFQFSENALNERDRNIKLEKDVVFVKLLAK